MMVGDTLCSPMNLIAPCIDKLLAAPVQFLHGCKAVSLYELLFQIVERRLNLPFFTGPIAGACIQFCSQMLRKHQRLRIIPDLLPALWIVFNHQRFRVIDQQFQRHASQVFEQLLDRFIDRRRINLQGEAYGFLPGCCQDHGKTVNLSFPGADHHGVL